MQTVTFVSFKKMAPGFAMLFLVRYCSKEGHIWLSYVVLGLMSF